MTNGKRKGSNRKQRELRSNGKRVKEKNVKKKRYGDQERKSFSVIDSSLDKSLHLKYNKDY